VFCVMRPGPTDASHFPDPQVFEPARWLGADAGAAKRVAMPFGAGPRLCPGRYLALLEMKMVAALLLGGFELEAVETPDGGEAREALNFTMAPVGLKLRLKTRSNA
jgi:cytochrome P450